MLRKLMFSKDVLKQSSHTSAVEMSPPGRFTGRVCPSSDTKTLLPTLSLVELYFQAHGSKGTRISWNIVYGKIKCPMGGVRVTGQPPALIPTSLWWGITLIGALVTTKYGTYLPPGTEVQNQTACCASSELQRWSNSPLSQDGLLLPLPLFD